MLLSLRVHFGAESILEIKLVPLINVPGGIPRWVNVLRSLKCRPLGFTFGTKPLHIDVCSKNSSLSDSFVKIRSAPNGWEKWFMSLLATEYKLRPCVIVSVVVVSRWLILYTYAQIGRSARHVFLIYGSHICTLILIFEM